MIRRTANRFLRKAIELEPDNEEALVALADVRAAAGDRNEALVLSRRATSSKQATASTWRKRAIVELGAGDRVRRLPALIAPWCLSEQSGATDQRAKLLLDLGDKARAIEDIFALWKRRVMEATGPALLNLRKCTNAPVEMKKPYAFSTLCRKRSQLRRSGRLARRAHWRRRLKRRRARRT
jgi:hypothetical protein